MNKLGQHLRDLRKRHRISLRQVAAKARITAPYLSDIELGRRHPSDRVLADLARVLRTPVDELRQHDPKALLREIEERMAKEDGFAEALRCVLRRWNTAEELLRIVSG